MQILSLTVDPRCHGPLSYRLRWKCRACQFENQSVLPGSLLAEGNLLCQGCAEARPYHFPEELLEKRLGAISKAGDLEKDCLSLLGSRQCRDLEDLGYNVNFALFSHLANILSRELNE